MPDIVQTHFDSRAAGYDGNRRFLIPNFDEYYSIAVDVLTCAKADPLVLDLGGGTGLTTASLLKRYPDARVTMFDFSEEMLAVAKERFAGDSNVEFAVGDYRSTLPSGSFDIVISGLSIHHLSFGEKQDLARRVYDILGPAGEFVNSDVVSCEIEPHEQEMHRRLDDFISCNMDKEQLRMFNSSLELDLPITVSEQFEILRKAGFETIDCLYRYWNYGVFYARK